MGTSVTGLIGVSGAVVIKPPPAAPEMPEPVNATLPPRIVPGGQFMTDHMIARGGFCRSRS